MSGVRLENAPAAVSAPRSGNSSEPADSPLVLVLIPVLNPTPALVDLARELLSTPPAALIVVDDGSGPGPDGIHDALCEELRALGALVHRLPRNRGKGAALRAGIELAGRRFPGTPVVTADADGQHLPEDVSAVACAVRAATDEDPDAPVLVVGSRRFGAGTPLRSRVGNAISTVLTALLTGRRVPDTQSGLRGISPAAMPWMLAQRGDRYEYEMRVLMGMAADRGGRRVRAVPVTTVYEEGNPTSHFRPVRDSLRVLRPALSFLVSGALSAAVDVGLYLLLLTAGTPVAGAVIAARTVSAVLNFLLNRHLVFRDGSPWWRAATRYLLLALALVVGSAVLTPLLVAAGIPALPAKLMADLALAAVSFCRQRACAAPREAPGRLGGSERRGGGQLWHVRARPVTSSSAPSAASRRSRSSA